MSSADLIKLGVSALAVAMMVGLAAWARIARPTAPLDCARARSLLADEFPDHRLDGLWVTDDGEGAIGRAGDAALVITRLGDGYVARHLPWSRVSGAQAEGGWLHLRLGDVAAPRASLAFSAWPPQDTGKDIAA